MADTPERNAKAKAVRDYVNRAPVRPSAAELASQRRLWDAMNEAVTGWGGFITSLPGLREIRIECVQGSDLPSKLKSLGYSPRQVGSSSRITGTAVTETIVNHSSGEPRIVRHPGIVPVDIISIELPGK
jgi:hypothetical protein